MHKVEIPQRVRDRATRRQGRRHAHEDVSPAQTALVIVDMQNYFMAPGQQVEIPTAREIVPNVNRLAHAVREAGGIVIWIRTIADPNAFSGWSHFHEFMNTPERNTRRTESLTDGAFGSLLWPELDVQPTDLILKKTRYSAFIQGSSDIEKVLRERGIAAVHVAGTTTNTCCESSARDAMMRDFRTTMISDANAAEQDAEHNASLTNFLNNFGDVATCDEIIARFESKAR